MFVFKREFTNECGNQIVMSVVEDNRGVTITAEGPHSEVEHTWTPDEAEMLRKMLNAYRDVVKS